MQFICNHNGERILCIGIVADINGTFLIQSNSLLGLVAHNNFERNRDPIIAYLSCDLLVLCINRDSATFRIHISNLLVAVQRVGTDNGLLFFLQLCIIILDQQITEVKMVIIFQCVYGGNQAGLHGGEDHDDGHEHGQTALHPFCELFHNNSSILFGALSRTPIFARG